MRRRLVPVGQRLVDNSYLEAPAVAGVELLLDFSVEPDVLLSVDDELLPESLLAESLFEDSVDSLDFLPDSRLSVR